MVVKPIAVQMFQHTAARRRLLPIQKFFKNQMVKSYLALIYPIPRESEKYSGHICAIQAAEPCLNS